jgi:hypothetical protein
MSAPWTADEIEDLITDAISDSMDMDWTARDGARQIMRELASCGLHITWTPERQALIDNPPSEGVDV